MVDSLAHGALMLTHQKAICPLLSFLAVFSDAHARAGSENLREDIEAMRASGRLNALARAKSSYMSGKSDARIPLDQIPSICKVQSHGMSTPEICRRIVVCIATCRRSMSSAISVLTFSRRRITVGIMSFECARKMLIVHLTIKIAMT
jgi:hypothetical protein